MRKEDFALRGSRIWLLALLAMALMPALMPAQPLFEFAVNQLEAYDRSGNWIWDADAPGFPTHDGNWLTFGGANPLYHYYAEKYIHYGTNTTLTCVTENVPLAAGPGEITINFSQFNMVSFRRINTVNPAAPWTLPGQSGDVRVYTNASGSISHNGTPVLYMDNATFVITTPYPTQAQIRALSPIFSTWTGDIGTGLFQTGYGFGDLNLGMSDPAWAALFASSNYKIDMQMINVISIPTPTTGLFNFTLAIAPAATPRLTGNQLIDLGNLPETVTVPGVDASVQVLSGTPGGSALEMHHIYLNEIGVAPTGTLPSPHNFTSSKYWELGSTFNSFLVNISFGLNTADFAKGSADWRVLYRPDASQPWSVWADYTLIDANTIRANNVNQIGEFTVASPFDETLPVEMSTLYATVNSENLAVLNWSTASETDMLGFKVYTSTTNDIAGAECLTPVAIPASNTSTGASYTYTADEITEPGEHWFWLEAVSFDGTAQYFGPMYVILTGDPGTPGIPDNNSLGIAYPNPFKAGGSTSFAVEVKAGEAGDVTIFNTKGQTLARIPVSAGSRVVNWDGKDANGEPCGSGIYFYRLSTDTFNGVKKMLVIR